MTKEKKQIKQNKEESKGKRLVRPVHQGPAAQYEEPDLVALQRAVVYPVLAPLRDILALQPTVGNHDA